MSHTPFETVLHQALQLSEIDQLRLIIMLQASIKTDTTHTLARALDRDGKRDNPRTQYPANERRRYAAHSIELDALNLSDETADLPAEWHEQVQDWLNDSSFSVTDTH